MKVSASEFKAKCLALIDPVQSKGEVVTITKRGRVVAKLVAEHESDDQPWLALRGKVVRYDDPLVPALDPDDVEAFK